jgi:hypothetical protein
MEFLNHPSGIVQEFYWLELRERYKKELDALHKLSPKRKAWIEFKKKTLESTHIVRNTFPSLMTQIR